ncbi:hypothetical protein [Martelella alba]|uniref:Uncharacterized protein n=1 Tax=Martelella alba TaxID=2590451 RepID=A0ABY2SQ88_9HYPH|nr:hypothetical protein [Martelella alba]TKI07683.1 hypothetical protein FCN80_04350 [Martelella alba]
MRAVRYSLLLLAAALGTVSLYSAAEGPQAPSNPPVEQRGWPIMPPHPGPIFMPHHPGACQGEEVFCAAVRSDNPGETVQKLNGILPPAVSGEHYEVVVSVVKIPDHPAHGAGSEHGVATER